MTSIHSFLESDIRYQIQLLDYLYIKESQWTSIEELADEVGLQSRSVLKYILAINEVVTTNYLEKLSCEMQGHHSFKLVINENRSFFELRIKIMEQSINIAIWKKLFFFNELNIVKFSIENYLSVSTIKRKIKNLNSIIKSLEFKITSRDHMYFLKGNEMSIRFFFTFFFWDIYNGIRWPFYNIDQKKIFNLVESVTEELKLPIAYSFKSKFAYISAVGMTRYFHNQPIILEKKEEWEKLIKINNELVKNLPINFLDVLKEDYWLSEDEAHHEFSRIQVGQSFYQNRNMGRRAIELHAEYKTLIYTTSQNFLELLEKHLDIELTDSLKEQIMTTTLCGHYKAFFYNEIPLLKLEVDGILSNYRSLRVFIEKIYKELNSDEKSFVFKQKNFLISQYMYVVSEILPLNCFEPKISVYFDDPIDYPREILVKKMLTNFFDETFNLKVYGPSDILLFDKKSIDIVLSSFYTDEIIDNYPDTPIVFLKSGVLNISKEEILLLKEGMSIISSNQNDKVKLHRELKENRKIFISDSR